MTSSNASNPSITTEIHSSKTSNTNGFSDLADALTNGTDDLANADETTKDIYNQVVVLLVHRMQTWLRGDEDLEAISAYLGFPSDVVYFINVALTELLYRQRRGEINIGNLAEMYYYSCDIGHVVRDHGDRGRATVAERFRSFVGRFGFENRDISTVSREDVDSVTGYLRERMRATDRQVSPSYSASVPSMKNRAFVDEPATTAKRTVNDVTRRFIDEYRAKDAESCERETDAVRVTENHVRLMGKLIPDVFGYVYNHFELLTELRRLHRLDAAGDEKAVRRFTKVLHQFMEIFMNRYFEFRGDVDQTFLDAMYPLIDFADPDSAPERPELTILDYENQDGQRYNDHMWKLMDHALGALLPVFGDETVEHWKEHRSLRIDYPSENPSKKELLNLLNGNTDDALDILGTFFGDFALGVEYYDKFKLDNSQWPGEIY